MNYVIFEGITKQTTPFHIRTKYLTLVEKWGTEEQKREVKQSIV